MMRMMLGPLLALAAGSAGAQAAGRPPVTLPAVISLADLGAAPAPAYALANAVRAPGVARTSVDHRFGGLTGSAGFLCGLQPSLDHEGGRDVTGFDPHGRFVGAKLSFAFR